MTGREMRALSRAAGAAESAQWALSKVVHLLAAADALRDLGAEREWAAAYRAGLMERAKAAKATLALCEAGQKRFEDILSSCPDPQTEQILRLKYQRHFSWRNVALRVGGGNTEDSVRKRAERYLKPLK